MGCALGLRVGGFGLVALEIGADRTVVFLKARHEAAIALTKMFQCKNEKNSLVVGNCR